MFALILNGIVIQVSDETFPVCPDFKWVECDESVKNRWTYDLDKGFSEPEKPVFEPIIIETPFDDIAKKVNALWDDAISGTKDKILELDQELKSKGK
ncbi:MAG: hypothetical protein KBD83_07450 [Gammaproteobacteria bacterium]|nr:hypothetical protein [Gammaproteobacteria bacterium]